MTFNKNIKWISGKGGSGKTTLADFIVREFEYSNLSATKLSGKDFVDLITKFMRASVTPQEDVVEYLKNFKLIILDDLDYYSMGKRKTQQAMKAIILNLVKSHGTRVVIITQKRARKLRDLKLSNNDCLYLRLKPPSVKLKRSIIGQWMRDRKLTIPEDTISDVVDKTDNLFELKGLVLRSALAI